MSLRFELFRPPAGGDRDLLARAAIARRPVGTGVLSSLLAHGPAAAQLSLLEGGALAVTTGQQAGLFTGPMFSVIKGVTAAALAQELTRRLSRPVVPVFWVAGDDHDFAEINHCVVLNGEARAERVVLRERPAEAPMLPAYREPVGQEGEAALARLESLLPPSDFRTETLDWLARAYRPERSLAEAYAQAMAELLGPMGVVVVRGWHAEVKRAGMPAMLGVLAKAAPVEAALKDQASRLAAAQQPVPVEIGDGLTLVMIEGQSGRDRLRVTPSGFATRRAHETFSLAELERIAESEPERLSPNVLLRPVVEAAALPTVAYVGGPGELAYLAETPPVFELLGVERQAFVPRATGAFVEAKVDKVLERYGLGPGDLAKPSAELAARVARDDMPPDAALAISWLRESITSGYDNLRESAMAVERTLEKPVESVRNQALGGLNDIEKKLVSALKRRSDTALQQLERTREALYPEGSPQERVITIASVLSRHGRPALDLAFAAAREHVTSVLEASGAGS